MFQDHVFHHLRPLRRRRHPRRLRVRVAARRHGVVMVNVIIIATMLDVIMTTVIVHLLHLPPHRLRVLVEHAVRPALFLLFQDVQNVDHLDLAKKVAVLDLTIHLIPVLVRIVQAGKLLQPLEKLVRLLLATRLEKVTEVLVLTIVIVPPVIAVDLIVVMML